MNQPPHNGTPFAFFDPDKLLSNEVDIAYRPVTAIVLNWKRPDNVRRIVRYLIKHKFIDEIIVWNNSEKEFQHSISDVESKIQVINSTENQRDLAKYRAAASAKNEICFYQDDDWYTNEYLRSLYHAYLLRPDTLHTATSATNWARNWNWSFYNEKMGIQAEFSWIGCGAFFSRNMARDYLKLILDEFSHSEQYMADTGFSLLQNGPIVCCQVPLRPLSQDSAYSSQPQFEKDRGSFGNRVMAMLGGSLPQVLNYPKCTIRSMGSDILLFSSSLPMNKKLSDVVFDPSTDLDYLNRPITKVSESEITAFVETCFTNAFGENQEKYWQVDLRPEDIWGVLFLKNGTIRVHCKTNESNNSEILWRVRTDTFDEIITTEALNVKELAVASTLFITLVSDMAISAKIKLTFKEIV